MKSTTTSTTRTTTYIVMMTVTVMMLGIFDMSTKTITTTAFTIERRRYIPFVASNRNQLSSMLFSSLDDSDRVKKSGGGIPVGMPPGHNSVFDPSIEGRIGGTYERIYNGLAFSSSSKVESLSSPVSVEHVQNAGGGIPLNPAGNNCVFDPSIEGKLYGPSLHDRIKSGASYQYTASSTTIMTTTKVPLGTILFDTQHWLEDLGIPQNFAKATSPVPARVLGRARIITEDTVGDIQHILLQLPTGFHYIEGQSISVIPPGIDPTNNKPYKPRLYSIASTRYGDLLDGRTVSLCIRRAQYFDPITSVHDPTKDGICSNYLCNVQRGDTIMVAGPVGKTMTLPDDIATKDIIMVATGTGIAPFRGFLHRLFMENTLARHMYTGKAWLLLGVATTGGLLYQDELHAMVANSNGHLEVSYAISREMKNQQGGKYYVQDILTERADELFTKLENGAIIYFCGLKGMMPGILTALEHIATSKGINWSDRLSTLQKNHQWHVEVY